MITVKFAIKHPEFIVQQAREMATRNLYGINGYKTYSGHSWSLQQKENLRQAHDLLKPLGLDYSQREKILQCKANVVSDGDDILYIDYEVVKEVIERITLR